MRLPDFLIAGAPRSGTTWLARALDLHREIWLAKPLRPEPKFFLVDELYREGLDTYVRRWFAAAPAVAAVGEKSTNYLESSTAAGRIARDLPDVKLIFVLRDPVDRALSNYRWTVMNGLEDLDFATALEAEAGRDASLPEDLRYARPYAYFSRGRYADLLRPYFELVGAERICCVRFEDLVRSPERTLSGIHTFLGVEADPGGAGDLGAINASEVDVDVEPEVLQRLRRAYREPNRELRRLLGPSFAGWDDEDEDRP